MKKPLSEFYEKLKALGLPITHVSWEVGKVPPLPYLVYYQTGKNPWHADNTTFYSTNVITVELYSDYKDEKLEALLEAFFCSQNITLSSVGETFWEDEHLYEVAYEFEI